MSTPSQTRLLFDRRFLPFFATQLLTAFNDNFFKNALVIWVSARGGRVLGLSPPETIALATGLFILPFFVLSATAGQLADKGDKTRLVRIVKLCELAIMLAVLLGFLAESLPVLLLCLCAMGVHSAFMGPAKYGILPQLVSADELVAANALVEMGTFLAILVGTIGGGVCVLLGGGPLLVGVAALATAGVGLLTSFAMRPLPAVAPELRVGFSPIGPTLEILRITHRTRAVFLSVLGISWFWFFGSALLSLFPVYVKSTLGASEPVVTLFLAIFCVGIAVGSLACEKISGKNLELGLVPVGSLGMLLCTLDLYFVGAPYPAPASPLSLAGFLQQPGSLRIAFDLLGLSLAGGLFTVPLYTLVQQRAEPATRSRVVAGNNVLNALFMVLGSALLAVLFRLELPLPLIFLVMAGLTAAVAIYVYSLLPEFMLRFIAWILSRVLYRLELSGHEQVPEQGPAVLVCNHVSFVDWLIIAGSIRRPIRFVMDHRIAGTPVVSLIFKQGKAIPIAPEREDKALMEEAFARMASELREGELVCIFPEGKITKTGAMNAFRPGIERIVRETPVPVVPMALDGLWGSLFSRKDGPALHKLPRRFRARVALRIGAPLPAEHVTAAALEARVAELLGGQAPARV